MKCREVRRLVYLYREGEIPEELRRQVLQHAGSCRRCANELQQASWTGMSIANLRNAEPELHAGRDLTEQIMRGIESVRIGEARPRVREVASSFRRMQVACTLAAVTVVAAFFVQNMIDVYRIAALEVRLDQFPVEVVTGPEEEPLAAVGLRTIAQVGRFLSPSPTTNNVGLRGRLRLREAVRSFFDMMEDGPPGFAGEVQRLRRKYPELWHISPLHGMTSQDRLVLSQQGNSLMKDLRKLLQPGQIDYEK